MQRCDEPWARLDRLLDRVFGELDVHLPISLASPADSSAAGGSVVVDFAAECVGGLAWPALKAAGQVLLAGL